MDTSPTGTLFGGQVGESADQSIRPSASTLAELAASFAEGLPHKHPPFNSRNWGHRWHSLCSYQSKLKPAIAYTLIKEFTSPGEIVLDPMSGAGTIPLEACLQGRVGWGNDIQEVAYILTKAKVGYKPMSYVMAVADDLNCFIERHKTGQDPSLYNDFGLNGKLPEYYHPETYQEVLAARKYIRMRPPVSWEQAFVYACLFHILHGNRPYALSRRSHPVIPFKPSGVTEYRPVAERLISKIRRMMPLNGLGDATVGKAFHQDLFDLGFVEEVDAVITSPPFSNSTQFIKSNWIRLWMSGWEPNHFIDNQARFVEYRQKNSSEVYKDFFEVCYRWLKPDGRLVMHVGQSKHRDMAADLELMSDGLFKVVYRFDESVVGREKFGIKDQGSTFNHQYLFMVKT